MKTENLKNDRRNNWETVWLYTKVLRKTLKGGKAHCNNNKNTKLYKKPGRNPFTLRNMQGVSLQFERNLFD